MLIASIFVAEQPGGSFKLDASEATSPAAVLRALLASVGPLDRRAFPCARLRRRPAKASTFVSEIGMSYRGRLATGEPLVVCFGHVNDYGEGI